VILHKLILRHLKHGDDKYFYSLQADDAIRWIKSKGVKIGPSISALDLGCGHGVFGSALLKHGCKVTFADEHNQLLPELVKAPFVQFNIDADDFAKLGRYDLVICSNVLEHLEKPDRFLRSAGKILNDGGTLFLSWTNWLSLWGGHEFSPFHYLGVNAGYRIFDKVVKKPRKHTPFVNLYPTYIGNTLRTVRSIPDLRIKAIAPRYYTELSFLMRIPLIREFAAWNCALLLEPKR
jgi:2-polyprenyl-3-methyl-5-hydroxy-6-metoxy-1,4-benzoquinol methylase